MFYYILASFFLSAMLYVNNFGTFLIDSVLMSNGNGNFLLSVKNGLFGSFSCSGVKVLLSVVTEGNLSTDLPVIFATQ